MTDREERVGKNEALFREVNERIEEVSTIIAAAPTIDILCECGRVDCHEQVSVPRADYERVRTVATQFIVLPGHEADDEAERVVSATSAYVVVEKKDEAAIVAEETNPRD